METTQKITEIRCLKLMVAFGLVIAAIGVGVVVSHNLVWGMRGIAGVLGLALLVLVGWRLTKHPEALYGLMLGVNALAPAFQIAGETSLVRDGLKAVGYGIALLLIALALSRVLRRPARLQLVPADLFVIGLLGWQLLALFEAESLRNTIVGASANILVILTCTYGLRILLQERPQAGERFLVFWHLTGLLVAGMGLLLIVTGPVQIGPFQFENSGLRQGLPYVSSIFSNPNAVGCFTYIGLIATYGMWRRLHKRKIRLYLLLSSIVMGGGLLLSFSRSAYLGLAVGGLIIFWKHTPDWFKIVTLVALVVLGSVAYSVMKNDVRGALLFKLGSGLTARDQMWSSYLTFLQESPVVGKGAINIHVIINRDGRVIQKYATAHNAYISAAVQSGYVGLGLFICTYIMMMAMAIRGQRLKTDFAPWIAWTGLAMAIAIGVQQFFESSLLGGLNYIHLTFWMALTLAIMPLFRYRSARRLTDSAEASRL